MHNITLVLNPSYEQSNIVSAGSFILSRDLLLAEQEDWSITDAAYTMTLGNGQTVDVPVQCGTCIFTSSSSLGNGTANTCITLTNDAGSMWSADISFPFKRL